MIRVADLSKKGVFGDIFVKDVGLLTPLSQMWWFIVISSPREGDGEWHMKVQLMCEGVKEIV